MSPEPYRVPAELENLTFVWSAEPGFNLLDDVGRVVRAAAESNVISLYFSIDAAYPGFDDALADLFYRDAYIRFEPDTYYGTRFNRLMSVTAVDGGYDATYCRQSSKSGKKIADDRYLVGFYGGGTTEFVSLRRPSIGAGISPAPTALSTVIAHGQIITQQSPGSPKWLGPSDNIFGDWKVSFPSTPNSPACIAWGNTVAATPVLNKYVEVDVPPQTLPQYPTW